jgi:hypothetical protein
MSTMATRLRGSSAAVGAAIASGIAALAIGISIPLDAGDAESSLSTTPEWFAPIQKHYAGVSGMTPSFDFASLYGTDELALYEPLTRAYHGKVTASFDFASLYGTGASSVRVMAPFDYASLYSAR